MLYTLILIMVKITLIDGGMGQELYRRSSRPAHPLWSLQVMRESPELVQEVHEDFIRAGARVITLNTYTATPPRLARDGQSDWFQPLQAEAFTLANAARASCGKPFGEVLLAGCLPPLVGSYDAESAPPESICREHYRAIVEIQPEVDLWICETLPSLREGVIAAEEALASGKPVLLSYTVQDDGSSRLRSGEPVEAVAEAVNELPLRGLLLNCSTPEAIDRNLPALAKAGIPYGAYANGFVSVEALKPGGTVDVLSSRKDLGPEAYADRALSWVRSGATLVGGCCEVGPEHIRHLHQALMDNGYLVGGL